VKFFEKLRYGKQYGYEALFKQQPKTAAGKVGVIISESGLPEDYELEFYANFMEHVFKYTLPPFLVPLILKDKGMGLLDPDNPLAREEFKPRQLIDAQGSFTNKAGKPYTECEVKWIPPGVKKNPWDHGYFLYTGDGANGFPDVCDKVGAKIVGWYYGKLIPEKKVAWRSQLRKVYEDAVGQLAARYPDVEFRNPYYMYPESMRQAVDELLAAGCKTIVYQSINCPLYTDFEDYGHTLEMIHEMAGGRTRVLMADQLGNQAPMREAFLAVLRDQLAELPREASVMVLLSRHGHPFKKETQDARAHLYRDPLEAGVREIMSARGGKWQLTWTFDEYADEYWDERNSKLDTKDAYAEGIKEGYDFIIELPTDFPAENTDLMIFHAMKKFTVFEDYDRNAPVSYPDWEKPLVRKFHAGKTTGIYAGCPVGPYRKYVVDALVASIEDILK
jgi:hypothetical protein